MIALIGMVGLTFPQNDLQT